MENHFLNNHNVKDSLQRLQYGLERTINVFKVYSDDGRDDISDEEFLAKQSYSNQDSSCSGSAIIQRPPKRFFRKRRHSQVRFDKKRHYKSGSTIEEELDGIDHNNPPDSFDDEESISTGSAHSLLDKAGDSSTSRKRTSNDHEDVSLGSTQSFSEKLPKRKPRTEACGVQTSPEFPEYYEEDGENQESLNSTQSFNKKTDNPFRPKKSLDSTQSYEEPRRKKSRSSREDSDPKSSLYEVELYSTSTYGTCQLKTDQYYPKESQCQINEITLPDGAKVTQCRSKTDNTLEDTSETNKAKQKGPHNYSVTYFNDGKRQVDFILTYTEPNDDPKVIDKCKYFLSDIHSYGLQTETVGGRNFNNTRFIKIHIPKATVMEIATLHQIPLALESTYHLYDEQATSPCMDTMLTNPNSQDMVYKRNPESVSGDQPLVPTSAERITTTYEILKIAYFGDEISEYGVPEMLSQNILTSAYPLHENGWQWTTNGSLSDRQLLKRYWANWRVFNKKLPIQLIKKYFGPEVAFYYAWLGFYTVMLIIASIVAIIILLYSAISVETKSNSRVQELCEKTTLMCPLCRHSVSCKYGILSDSCGYAKTNYLFDNTATMAFGILMLLWTAFVLTFWRRKQTILRIGWDLFSDNNDLSMRPEYERRATKWQVSPITGEREPYRSPVSKCCAYTLSMATILLLIFVILILVLGIALYRATAIALFSSERKANVGGQETTVSGRGSTGLYATLTGSLLTAVFIIIFSCFYSDISVWLTKKENPRTQYEYDKSYLIKMFILAFANNYAVAFYLAFFRGASFTHPGDKNTWITLFGINTDSCDPSGCTADLSLHIIIIMIVKALVCLIVIVLWPLLIKCLKKPKSIPSQRPQWELDYTLKSTGHQYVAKLYMEIVIQYGFVIFFAAALYLAPMIALIINILSIRIMAMQLIQVQRRPIPKKTSIDIWNNILKVITYIGIITNAFVIAFTSDFVPRQIFRTYESYNLTGYVDSTLSKFQANFYNRMTVRAVTDFCYYRGKRYPPDAKEKYQLTADYFFELLAKLILAIIIVIVGFLIIGLLYCIFPDIPYSVREEINQSEKRVNRSGRER